MASLLRIFNPFGIEIENFYASVVKSQITAQRGAEGDCSFSVSTLGTHAREKVLQFGNFVLIEAEDGDEDWVGVIDCEPQERTWSYGSVSVMAYTAERILKYGSTDNKTITMTAGALFRQALNYFNEDTVIRINEGSIDDATGVVRQETFGSDPFTHIQQVASRSGHEWSITHKIEDGKLQLFGNWMSSIGYDTGRLLHDGVNGNIELTDPIISEGGLPIYNTVVGYSEAGAKNVRLKYIAKDSASRAKYGVRCLTKVYSGISTQAGLEAAVNADLEASKEPFFQYELNVLDTSLFPLIRRGNIFDVNISEGGFSIYGGIGYEGVARIYSKERDDQNPNKIKLGVEKYVRR